MTKKIIFGLCIMILTLSGLHAKEGQIKREFTVTTIALDAQNQRLQSEEDNDNNDTKTQGGGTEEN